MGTFSLRVRIDVLETLEAAGKSPPEIARAALEREARLTRQAAALERLRRNPLKLTSPEDAAKVIRDDRDSR